MLPVFSINVKQAKENNFNIKQGRDKVVLQEKNKQGEII